MKWDKLGRIFCPDHYQPWMVSHAAVPTAEHLADDLFRVYFSCRDAAGRSHVGYVDLDVRRPQPPREVSSQPVLAPGPLGSFDEDGSILSWITRSGDRKYFYYIGWNQARSVPFRNAVGLAAANGNAEVHKCFPGPILDRSPVDPCFVASCCVRLEGNLWRMWYLSCIKWERVLEGAKHYYHIKYATSVDGVHWNREGRVSIDFQSPSEYAISRPCVVKDGDRYRMWYSYRGSAYRIGYAEATDGIDWQRKDEQAGLDVSSGDWDSEMVAYPFVFDHKGSRYMLYNGNGYGKTGFGLAILTQD